MSKKTDLPIDIITFVIMSIEWFVFLFVVESIIFYYVLYEIIFIKVHIKKKIRKLLLCLQ
jgi:hypothetical protein